LTWRRRGEKKKGKKEAISCALASDWRKTRRKEALFREISLSALDYVWTDGKEEGVSPPDVNHASRGKRKKKSAATGIAS